MTSYIHQVWQHFQELYRDPHYEDYYRPPLINIQKKIDNYLFSTHQPAEECQKILDVLRHHVYEDTVLVNEILKKSWTPSITIIQGLIKQKFKVFYSQDMTGIVIEHPELAPGWLIKKTFAFTKKEEKSYKILKTLEVDKIPFWLFPFRQWPTLWKISERIIEVENKYLNPLRVEMLERSCQTLSARKLKYLIAPQEYLYPLLDVSSNTLYKKYVVISKKLNLLETKDNAQRFIELAETNPDKLKVIIKEICELIKSTHLTDMDLFNLRFVKKEKEEDEDQLASIDFEPLGGVADISQKRGKEAFKGYDYMVFPLFGLRRLQESAPSLLEDLNIESEKIAKVKRIFDEVINEEANKIIQQRRRYYAKILISVGCPLIPLAFIITSLITPIFAKLFYKKPQRFS